MKRSKSNSADKTNSKVFHEKKRAIKKNSQLFSVILENFFYLQYNIKLLIFKTTFGYFCLINFCLNAT